MSELNGTSSLEQHYHENVSEAQWKLTLQSIPQLKRASSLVKLDSIGLLDVLQFDGRPTFAVDVSSAPPPDGLLDLVYLNPALEKTSTLLDRITGKDSPGIFTSWLESHVAFKKWIWAESDQTDSTKEASAYLFHGHLWWATTVKHTRIISGVPTGLRHPELTHNTHRDSISFDPREHKEPKNLPQMVQGRLPSTLVEPHSESSRSHSSPPSDSPGPFDYTLDPPPNDMSDHIKYFKNIDWDDTPLGPMRRWSPQLRCLVNVIMNDSQPAILFWGEHVTMIYNESYIQIISLLHPCMGQSARVAASDYWPHFQPLVDHINTTGDTLTVHDMPLFLDRHGFLEETFFSFQFVPILDSCGHIAGYHQPLVEITSHKLLERRVSNLVEIGSQTAKARDLETYWDLILKTIGINDKDAPFALLYAAEYQPTSSLSSVSSGGSLAEQGNFILKGSIGIDSSHPIAPATMNPKTASSIFHLQLLKALESRKPVLVHFEDLVMPDDFLSGIQWKGYGDPCRCVVVCPIVPTTSNQVPAFLILGVNPRRPFDDNYQQFVHVMLRLLATSLASVVLFDEEIRQKEIAIGQAARIQEQLLAELQYKENKFQRFAERASVSIFTMDPAGDYTYRNPSWYDLFQSAINDTNIASAWRNIAWPEDIPACESAFSRLMTEKVPIYLELKTTMPWKPPVEPTDEEPTAQKHYKWILCTAYPELDADKTVVEVLGNVTDISKQKWAEGVQKLRTDNALQSKKHLEHFIDTTSHEMRNPLSAIMQCADGILTACNTPESEMGTQSLIIYENILVQAADAARTIAQCAQHMKRIVDDILTVSKLDSGLLAITPIDTQPESVASHAVKMFAGEAEAAAVDMRFHVDPSFRHLGIDWVSLDPTRLLQILLNLITNALKFTRLESARYITVTIAASDDEPTSQPCGIQFETKLAADDPNLVEDWTQASTVFLQFSISDTGCGLTEKERKSLFARFSQASPRTHINYGGSGLGLFISRKLTEMQGGAIGLASEHKKGSTFSFYVKARRTKASASRRSSFQDIFPEDMRHRANTRHEIDRLHNPPQSQVNSSDEAVTKSTRPNVRRQSVFYSDGPTDDGDHSPEQGDLQLERAYNDPQKLHILIVEDNLVNQKVLARQLRNLGCRVSVANHGAEALAFLKWTRFWNHDHANTNLRAGTSPQHDSKPKSPSYLVPTGETSMDLSLILMDWEMPIMNGLEAVSRIRELERAGLLKYHVPVIGITANVRQQQIQSAIDAGMDDVVSKPFRVPELMNRMKGVLRTVSYTDRDRAR